MTEHTLASRVWRPGPVLGAASMVILWLAVRTIVQGDAPLIDEEQHQRVIHRFLGGRWELPGELPMLPAYHLLAAGFEWALGDGLFVGRLFSVCMALVGFGAFALLSQIVRGDRWPDSFRLYAYHPLLFPFTAMIYTDQTAMFFLVLALLAHGSGRFGWAAVALASAVALRQTNLVWVVVLLAWTVSQHREASPAPKGTARAALCMYGLVVLAATLFLAATGRLTAGAVPLNQPAFNIDQYYVLCLFVLLLWAPVFLHRTPGDVRALVSWSARRPAVAALVGFILVVMIVVLGNFYANPHPWNQIGGLVRNWPLRAMERSPGARLVLLLACAWSVYQTVRFTLERRNRAPLTATWGAGLLSLSVLGLVEPRYYLPMLILADFFNEYEPRHAAWLARWYQSTTAAVCALSLTGRFW